MSKYNINPVVLLATGVALILLISHVQCELFTAQVELEPLFQTQENIVEAFESYLSREENRLKEIRRRLVPYIQRGQRDHQEVLDNPISAFLLVKGLTLDLDDLLTISDRKTNSAALASKIANMKNNSLVKFPNNEDLSGAATALTRLQETYLLEPKDMAQGYLHGHCCSMSLTAEDLFELGRQTYNLGDHDHTIGWMNEALIRYQDENRNGTIANTYRAIGQNDILEYLAFSTYQKGELSAALSLTEQLVQLDPDHPRAAGNIGHYKKMILDRKGEDGGITDQTFTVREKRATQVGWEKAKYEALCRGEAQTYQPKARCAYAHGGDPYLLIGPVKQELVHVKPHIYIYHDVLFDKEIKIIQDLAKPRFKRATVHDHATGELVTAQYRISKSSWLQAGEHPTVDTVNKRIKAVTRLELNTAEELQVVNYGLGGHYEPHFDFARRDEKDAFQSLGTGNRIATFLFYMTDVELGGATVFPSLDLTLWPRKGAAAFWYNLFEDGNGDTLTRHAACPVLLGSKWVANKWIHERGQEFIRPCKLSPTIINENDA